MKSNIDLETFWQLWYNGDEIDIDAIEDATLKSMYIEYVAQENDLADMYEKIVRYLDARLGSAIHGDPDESLTEQSDERGYRLLD